ncbi:MAG: type II toxin-antitoxin system VapC family toxin [Thermoplasmata archaeon]|nr:type II toxin-antitoxin system VapC family toxin [Thermoplasmata archaeon]
MTYLLDTCIISAVMKGNKVAKQRWREAVIKGDEILISAIAYYEIKRGLLKVRATRQLSDFNKLCQEYRIALLDKKSIFDKASEIYATLAKEGNLAGDADILIASTAIENKIVVVTDDRDFERIPEVKTENWLLM